jgi:hypothetical protein
MAGKVVRIGCGSGGAIDRVEDALDAEDRDRAVNGRLSR